MRRNEDNPKQPHFLDCIGAACAWFYEANDICAVQSIPKIEEILKHPYQILIKKTE